MSPSSRSFARLMCDLFGLRLISDDRLAQEGAGIDQIGRP